MDPDWLRLLSPSRRAAAPEVPGRARSPFQRDHDRVLFSGPFRRLADKTQVFPLPYDDHVHSRLTHSLEVAAIGRSLGTLVGRRILADRPGLAGGLEDRDFGDCIAAACLAHDLGNPPFGHVGEEAIQEFFRATPPEPLWAELSAEQRADFARFEGNAQTFRIVTRLERPLREGGLDLAHATLGALVKYPCTAAAADRAAGRASLKKHGVFGADLPAFELTATALGLARAPGGGPAWRRHPLAFLTEAADDIAYNILDLEDGYRLKYVDERAYLALMEPLRGAARPDGPLPPPRSRAEQLDRADFLRAAAVDTLVHQFADAFVARLDGILDGTFDRPLASEVPDRDALAAIGRTCLERCYRARDVLKMELTGAEAIQGLLAIFTGAFAAPGSLRAAHLARLLPTLFEEAPAYEKLLRLTDHVSGMTDHYAVRLYRELRGMRYPGGRD
jgi:dGTPase